MTDFHRYWEPDLFVAEKPDHTDSTTVVRYDGKFIVIFSPIYHSLKTQKSFMKFLKENFTPAEYFALYAIADMAKPEDAARYSPFGILKAKGWKVPE